MKQDSMTKQDKEELIEGIKAAKYLLVRLREDIMLLEQEGIQPLREEIRSIKNRLAGIGITLRNIDSKLPYLPFQLSRTASPS